MQIGYALEEIMNPRMKRKKDVKRQGIAPEAAAEAVFAEMTDISEDEALALKQEYVTGGRSHECARN